MLPPWQNTSRRRAVLRMDSKAATGSGMRPENEYELKARAGMSVAVRSSVNVVATALSNVKPVGGFSSRSKTARLSGASIATQTLHDVVHDDPDRPPPVGQLAGARRP